VETPPIRLVYCRPRRFRYCNRHVRYTINKGTSIGTA
jgi:hypothetical protein